MLTFVYLNSDGQVNLDSFELDVGTFGYNSSLKEMKSLVDEVR